MLSGVAVEIEKVERSLRQMEAQMERGFGSDTEVKSFLKTMEQTENAVLSIHKGLKDVARTSLTDSTKDLQKQLDTLNKQIDTIQKNLKTSLTKGITDANLPKEIKDSLKDMVRLGNLEKQNFEQAKVALREQISLYDKLYIKRKDALVLGTKTKAMDKAKVNLFGEGGLVSEDLQLSKKYGTRSGAEWGGLVRAKSANQNIRPTVKSDNFTSVINEHYVKILQQIALKGGQANQVIEQLLGTFKKFGLQDVDKEVLQKLSNKVDVDLSTYSKILSGIKGQKIADNNKELSAIQQNLEVWKGNGKNILDSFIQEIVKAEEKTGELQKKEEAAVAANQAQLQTLNQISGAISAESSNIDQASNQWANYREQLVETTQQQKQIDSGFEQIINRLKYFFSIGTVFNQVRQQIRQTFTDVQNLDKSFAQIAMVTKYEVSDMWKSYDQYAEMANRLGQATNDVIQASALYYQQGVAPRNQAINTWV